jgi:RHS repeat-associated protein
MRGTITKWVESDGTTILASREQDAFWTIIPNSASGTWPGRFGYQGQTWIEILSGDGTQRFLLNSARFYDPTDGRFLQLDPLYRNPIKTLHFFKTWENLDNFHFEDINLYQFVGNSPNNRVDPEGLGWLGILGRIAKRILKGIGKQFVKKGTPFIAEETKWLEQFFFHNARPGGPVKFPPGLSESEIRSILKRYEELAQGKGGLNPDRIKVIEEALKKLESGGLHNSMLGAIFASHTSEQRKRQECGEDVSQSEIAGAAVLDIAGIFDPGIIDLVEVSIERGPQALPLHAIGSEYIPGFPGGVRPSPVDAKDYPNFSGPPTRKFRN